MYSWTAMTMRLLPGKVLVTGGTGLLGQSVIHQLLESGAKVVALARDREKAGRLLGETGVEIAVGDMCRVDAFAPRLDGCDAVVHTAAYFRESFQPGRHAAALRRVNVEGAVNLVRAADARGVRRFVFIGSAGTIGRKPDGSPGDEDSPPSPIVRRNPYFRSKLEAQQAVRACGRSQRMTLVEILPGWMWVPGTRGPPAPEG